MKEFPTQSLSIDYRPQKNSNMFHNCYIGSQSINRLLTF